MGIEIPPKVVATPIDTAQAPAFSDDALALEFADRHAENLRFVATWNKWLFWDCAHWQFEETLRAWDFAREVCRDAADDCGKIEADAASSLASAKTVAAVERLARSDRRLAATIDQWDADPWLLNTPDGVVDLRTGRARHSGPKTTSRRSRPSARAAIVRSFLPFSIALPAVTASSFPTFSACSATASLALPASTPCSSATAPAPTERAFAFDCRGHTRRLRQKRAD